MLRTKSLFIVTISSIIVFLLIFINLKNSIEKDYEDIEFGISESVYKLINNEFNSLYLNLERLNIDWSRWDDTYEFINTKDPQVKENYVKSNLADDILEELDLNLIIFLDDQGKIVYQTSYDNNYDKRLSSKEITSLKNEFELYKGKTGMIIQNNNKILVFSNFGITDSNNSKKTSGNLIMGYFIDETRLKTLDNKLGMPLNILGISENSTIPYEIKIEKDVVLHEFYIPTLSDKSIILENKREANILFLGKENIKKYLGMLLINFFILIFVIYVFMETFIVKRLRNMDLSVKEIIKYKNLGKRLKTNGNDEIGNLGENINNLLEDIEIMKKRLYGLATYDVMTGIFNRHIGLEKLNEKFENIINNNGNLVIVFIDINNLKYVNDQLSHEEGDKLIKTVVKTVQNNIQLDDVFLRFGGDEFILGFDKLSIVEVKKLFNDIEKQFDKYTEDNNEKYIVSISFGMVECHNEKTLEEYINLADIEMYKDKKEKKKLPERIYLEKFIIK
ncbi:MAG: diguanylate cyclase [Psychrilyobacter sp.]